MIQIFMQLANTFYEILAKVGLEHLAMKKIAEIENFCKCQTLISQKSQLPSFA